MKFLRLLSIVIFVFFWLPYSVKAVSLRDVVINEIAWSGTSAGSTHEWVELFNNTDADIDLSGWHFYAEDWTPDIVIGQDSKTKKTENSIISAKGYYLLERRSEAKINDSVVSGVSADWYGSFGSGLKNDGGENLFLRNSEENTPDIDSVKAKDMSGKWFAGTASPDYFSMERKNPLASGDDPANWHSNDGVTRNGMDANNNPINGTPGRSNSQPQISVNDGANEEENGQDQDDDEIDELAEVAESTGTEEGSGLQSGSDKDLSPILVAANAGGDIFTFLGETIRFDGSKSTGGNLSFSWNLGNGEIIKEKQFGYVYQFPGKYIVTLTVSDGILKASDEARVEVISGGVKISEFLPFPEGKDAEEEWIEIHNSGDYLVDLGGWQLDDMADGGSKPWTFPARTFIQPRGYLVISRVISKIALNNDKDVVRLIYPNGVVADEINYEKPKKGMSGILMGGSFFWSKFPTPGATNILEADVVKSLGAKPINSYFVENFSEAYQSIIYADNNAGENKEKKNLIVLGSNETSGSILEEVSISSMSALAPGVGKIGTVAESKFVPSKNMLQATAAGNGFSVQKILLFVFLAFSFGAAAIYLIFEIKKKKKISPTPAIDSKNDTPITKRSWEIMVDE